MKNYLVFSMAALLVGASCNTKQEKAAEGFTGAPGEVKLVTGKEKNCRKNNQAYSSHENNLALHAVTFKIHFIPINIIPGKKTNSSCNDQQHNYHIYKDISGIARQRRKGIICCSQNVKSCITKSRNRMKGCHPDSL